MIGFVGRTHIFINDQLVLLVIHTNAEVGLHMPVVGGIYLHAHFPDRALRQVGDALVLVGIPVPLVIDAPESVGQLQAHARERAVGALLLVPDRF